MATLAAAPQQRRRGARQRATSCVGIGFLLWLCAPFYRVARAVRNTRLARRRAASMNASLKLLQSVLPTSVGLRVKISGAHPSAQILGTERMGSGTLIDPSGIILTVNYVVLGAETIEVTLLDETRLDGQVIAQDFVSGLAAIKIPGDGYPACALRRAPRACAPARRSSSSRRRRQPAARQQRRHHPRSIRSTPTGSTRSSARIITTAMNPGLGGGALFTNARRAGRRRLAQPERDRPLLARHSDRALPRRTATSCCATAGASTRPPRAWLGLYCYMLREHVVIAGVLPGAPGERGRPARRRRGRSSVDDQRGRRAPRALRAPLGAPPGRRRSASRSSATTPSSRCRRRRRRRGVLRVVRETRRRGDRTGRSVTSPCRDARP